ncbi:efflux RND transporter permease subunit [Alistipes communis]|jgi:multidrug efflux pump subunit AcrB|uniref:efflux RND transporter permease subunit n=1 Tax=Alistipes communis TaxID=2585118 RepID=UPI0025914CB0|nr:efflux RND transporter permease subunit [Alistipes communis]
MTNRFDINRSQRGIPAFSVLLIMAALAVIGVAMLPMLNVQYTPSPVERKIDVSFTWPDASARLIEQSVTSRIEGALSAITGSESVSSRSSKGSGRVTIRFRKGTEMAAARFEVASAIRNLYPKLPEEVSYPAISIATGGTRESDMLVYTIKADLPSRRIEEYVEAHMSTPLSQTEGVGKVSLSGVTPFEWVITFDPKAMEVNGISAADLAAAFRDYFRSDVIDLTTLPHADGTDRSIVLKLRNRASLNFGDIPIARRNGRIYHLRDFATARWCEAPPSTYFRINGLNTITLSIGCEASTNMLRVAENVKEEMQRLQAAFPPGISATLTYDASEYVSGELHKIYLRTLLCVAILMLFVYLVSRDFNYLLIIAVTLAVNILVAVVFYNLLNLDIHIYTLAGITVSLGIIIDSSIIMVDHYSYYRNRRVFVSILGALLTTIGALGIVWLLPEKQQANLTDFSLVIVINLVVSLIVALLFIPALLDKFPLKRSMTVSSVKRRRLTVRVSRAYARFIGWGRRHRWLFIVALIWGFGIPTFLLPEKIEPEKGETPGRGTELYNKIMEGRFMTEHRSFLDKFLGSSLHLFHTATSRYNNFREPEQKVLYVNAGMAEGCTVQQLNDVVRHMENYICQFDEVDMFRTRITSYDNARIEITFKPEYENSGFPSMLKQELTSAAINFGGATWRVWGIDDNSFNNNIVSSYRSNQIRLRGYNYDQLAAYADRLIDSLSTNRRVSEPEIMDGDAWTLPHNEFTIRYDDERIAATGLDVSDYYTILNTMLYQSRLPSVYNGEELQQVILESGDRDRFDRWHIANAQVGIDSLRTKLSTVGTIEKHRTGISIRRSKQSYEILVGFDFIGSYELGKRLIERTVRQLNDEILPIGFRADSPSHNFGRKEKQQQAWLILLVVAIIYTMCTILFESLRKPLVIILMIPISFIGVFLSFGWSDFIFDQGGFAAFVLLCGIVVNAGIYLINEEDTCAAISGKRGIALYLKAFNHKIVPISLTILSTILGLAPFLYDGPEEVFWFAFAIAAISGTFFSVVALLIYLPIFLPMRRNSR